MVLSYLLGAQVNFLSVDSAEDTKVANTYPSEFLNTLEVSGMPSHKLPLKIGAPMMLLRNLDPSTGLCNGMHLIVTRRWLSQTLNIPKSRGLGQGMFEGYHKPTYMYIMRHLKERGLMPTYMCKIRLTPLRPTRNFLVCVEVMLKNENFHPQ